MVYRKYPKPFKLQHSRVYNRDPLAHLHSSHLGSGVSSLKNSAGGLTVLRRAATLHRVWDLGFRA